MNCPTCGHEIEVASPLLLDDDHRIATHLGRAVELRPMECSVLRVLVDNAGLVVTRIRLWEIVWGVDLNDSSKALDVVICTLRRKLPGTIGTVRGVGYSLNVR